MNFVKDYDSNINYIKLQLLLLYYPEYDKLIKDDYLLLLSQLTKTDYLDTEVFKEILSDIFKMGIIYVGIIGWPDSEDFEIVATGTLIIEPKLFRSGKNVGHIEDIIVTKHMRGMGISQQILNNLKNEARENNCYKVILDCIDSVRPVYHKNGFNQMGSQMAIYFDK